MAVTQQSIDMAEYTFTFDLVRTRTDRGDFVEQMVENPWAFLRFADVGEERKYVVPINQAAWIGANGVPAGRLDTKEFMPYLPFPLELGRPARTNTRGDDNMGGPVAVHFFGWV